MDVKACLIQFGYDLELQYNVLKCLLDKNILFERHYLIDFKFEKDLSLYPKKQNSLFFSDLLTSQDERPLMNGHYLLPILLIMISNLNDNKDILYNIEEKYKKLRLKTEYNFCFLSKILQQTKSFLEKINISKYDVVCMGSTNSGIYNAVLSMILIRNKYPNIKIVLGGYLFTSLKELREVLYKLGLFDTFVFGDGELALKYILEESKFPKEIKMPVKNLNNLPFIEPGFGSHCWNNKNAAANIHSSRGCIYNCAFCTAGIYPFKCMNTTRLAEDIKRTVKDYNTFRIIISDNLICPSKKYIESLYKKLESMKLIGKIVLVFVEIPPNHLDSDIIKIMKKLDARIFVGVESFSQRMLDKIHKKTTVEQNIQLIENSLKYNLDIDLGRMSMFPGESMEEFKTSLKYFVKYLPKTIQSSWINTLTIFSNTPMYENPSEYGIEFEYFNEDVQNIIPKVSDLVKVFPNRYIDLTDPENELFNKKAKILKVTNEVLAMFFKRKWNNDFSYTK